MALPSRLFCDTSFFYACFDRRDVNHQSAAELSENAAVSGSRLYVTWDIISETLTLLRYRRTHREALTFLTEIKPHLHIVNYGDAMRTEAEQIFRRYSRDHRLSFCEYEVQGCAEIRRACKATLESAPRAARQGAQVRITRREARDFVRGRDHASR